MGIRDDLVAHAESTAQRTLSRLEGLTDDEFRWQPVPGAWTVRQLRDGRVIVDNNEFQLPPSPMPSIAWLVAHLIDIYGSPRNAKWLRVAEPATPPVGTLPWTIAWTADESVAILRTAIEHFVGLLRAVDDEAWWEPLGPGCEPYQDASLTAFALHQIDEAIHHAGALGNLRDLYQWTVVAPAPAEPPGTVTDAATAGRWDLVEALTLDGADVNGGSPTALHLAALGGDLRMVRLLVEHGADTSVKDGMYNGTPTFWARYFGRTEIVDYLRGVSADGD